MRKEEKVINRIQAAFGANSYPGDGFLQGSFEGCEPAEEAGAFMGKSEWRVLDSKMLDQHYNALSFFSEAGFRFFLPAYLVADVREELLTADPLFHLCHGFASVSVEMPVGSQTFSRGTGGTKLLNPRLYGAMTWSDYARHRLSIFTREESQAIVAYMAYKRGRETANPDEARIDAALEQFWNDRAQNAPPREALEAHLKEEEIFVAALRARRGDEK